MTLTGSLSAHSYQTDLSFSLTIKCAGVLLCLMPLWQVLSNRLSAHGIWYFGGPEKSEQATEVEVIQPLLPTSCCQQAAEE